MSSDEMTFVLTAKSLKSLCRLYEAKEPCIQVGKQTIYASKELLILVSKAAYSYVHQYYNAFQIDLSRMPQMNEENTANCLKMILSLCEGEELAQFGKSDTNLLKSLSKSLKNSALRATIDLVESQNAPVRLRWESNMLIDFSDLPNANEFCFKFQEERFECPKILAQLLSNEVAKRQLWDASFDILELTLPEGCDCAKFSNAFFSIFRLLSGNSLSIRYDERGLYESIASQIGCEELSNSIRAFDWKVLASGISNVYEELKCLFIDTSSSQFAETIKDAASHFYKLNIESLISIPLPIIQKVIESPHLKIQNEDQLFNFVKASIERNGAAALSLLSKVKFEYLDPNSVEEFLDAAKIESIGVETLKSFCEYMKLEENIQDPSNERWIDQPITAASRIVKSIQQKVLSIKVKEPELAIEAIELKKTKGKIEAQIESANGRVIHQISLLQQCSSELSKLQNDLSDMKWQIKTREFPPGSDENGVFAFFNSKKGCSSLNEKLLEVTASSIHSIAHRSENAIIWGDSSYWCPSGFSNEWLQIDFRENAFSLKEFTLLTSSKCLPQHFSLFASDSCGQLKEIKRFSVSDSGDIGQFKVYHFTVECEEPYKVFRIKQDSHCINSGYNFAIWSIEFFGTLVTPKASTLL